MVADAIYGGIEMESDALIRDMFGWKMLVVTYKSKGRRRDADDKSPKKR